MKLASWLLLPALLAGFTTFLSAQRSGEMTPADVFKKAKNSVVLIVASGSAGTAQGSGFIIAPDRVVTNFHVIDGQEKLFVKFTDGGIEQVDNTINADKSLDLAILAVNTGARPPLSLGDELASREGDSVLALGAPKGLELTLTNGIISSFRRDDNAFMIQSTAAIAPGSSGGPLLDSQGRVIGITTFLLRDNPGLYFSVAVSELKRLMRTTPANTGVSNVTGSESEVVAFRQQIERGETDAAKAAVTALLARDSENPQGLAIRGNLELHWKHYEEAAKLLSRAASGAPDSAAIQGCYALALIRTGEYKKALARARKADAIKEDALTLEALALASYVLDDLPTAKKAAQRLTAIDDRNQTALEVLAGAAYLESPGSPAWLALAKDVRKVNPKGSWALMLEWHEAGSNGRRILESVKQAEFPNELPYTILERSHLNQPTDIQAAAAELKPAEAAMPENSRLLLATTVLDLLRRDVAAAADHFGALQTTTANANLIHRAGCIYYAAVQKGQIAVQECKLVLDNNPDNFFARIRYGWAAIEAEQFALAVKEFRTAEKAIPRDLDQDSMAFALWLGVVASWWNGDEKDAKELFKILEKSGSRCTDIDGLKKGQFFYTDTQLARMRRALQKFQK